MATDKLFTVVGISSGDGVFKVRFANDISRVKALTRAGHTDIRLAELPEAMTKLDAVLAIADMDEFQDELAQTLFNDYISEHSGKPAKAKRKEVVKMTLDEALAQVPKRDGKGHFIKKEVREEMARELIEA